MILVSACLCGVYSRYDGKSNENKKLMELLKAGQIQLVCPEQLGGLSTPRLPCEILKDHGKAKIINSSGLDCTEAFIKGAYETLRIAKLLNAHKAVLKSRSPSCGCGEIYDGSFSGKLIEGNGFTAQLLLQNGIEVINENQI